MSNKNSFKHILEVYMSSVEEADKKGLAEVYKATTELLLDRLKAEVKDLADLDLHIKDVEYGDGYFIFGRGTNSTVTFRIEETPGWLYGLWWSSIEKDSKVILEANLFTQYEDEIDKFKPSASMVSSDISIVLNSDTTPNSIFVWNFARDIVFIHKEPYLAFYREIHYSNFNKEYISREEAKEYYDKHMKHKQLEAEIKEQNDKEMLEVVNYIFDPLIKQGLCAIRDFGENWSPRYHVAVGSQDIGEESVSSCMFDEFDYLDVEEDKKLYDTKLAECEKRADDLNIYWSNPISRFVDFIAIEKFNKLLKN